MSKSAREVSASRGAADGLRSQLDAIAEAVTAEHYRRQPELESRHGAVGREKCRKDAAYHLSYLAEALQAGEPSLFYDYIAWAKVMLAGRGIPEGDLAANLAVLRETIHEFLPDDQAEAASVVVTRSLNRLGELPDELSSLIGDTDPLADLSRRYLAALLAGKRREASTLILDAVSRGISVRDIYLEVFQPAQYEVGRLWQMNKISVAHEHYCTAATQLIMSQLYREIFSKQRTNRTFVAACVGGELHEIGVRMVADFFEMEGWSTFYLGSNMPSQSLIQTVCEYKADVIGISATITYHVSAVAELIRQIRANESCRQVKILVGGHPFNLAPELWKEIGADGCAPSAASSVDLARALLGEGPRC